MKIYTSIIATLLLLCCLGAQAGVENAVTLCIENKSGEVVEIPLIERPKISFKATYVILQASSTRIFKFKDLKQLYFTDEETAVSDQSAAAGEGIEASADYVCFSNFAPNTTVRVYTPSGMIVKQTATDQNGRLQLSLSNLARGTYIIKAGKTTFKFGNW